MKAVIITQDDPFYLGESLDYLLRIMPKNIDVTAAVVFDVSPFGKKETLFQKLKKSYNIFGGAFVIKYGFDFILAKLNKSNNVVTVLNKHSVAIVKLENNINKPESLEIIKSYQPDVLVSIAGNQIFRKRLINLAPKGCINLHTALLPKYRGLMPTFWVLKNNEKMTGVSVFFVDEGIDSGPIIVQKEFAIHNHTQKELIKETKKLGMEAIVEALVAIKSDSVNLLENNEDEMTYFSFPTREDVREFRRLGKKFY